MARRRKGVKSETKNGVKYWRAYVDGKYQSCGPGEEGRKRAVAVRQKWELDRYQMKDEMAGLTVKQNAFKTIGELIQWYLQQPSIQRQKKYRAKYCRMQKHLVPFFGNKPLKYAEPEYQEQYQQMRIEQGASPVTIAQEFGYLRATFLFAYKRKKILDEVRPREWLASAQINPRRIITDHEYKKLLEHAVEDDFKDLMICAYETGMRQAELTGLRKNQVRLNQGHFDGTVTDTIYLGVFDTKNKTERIIPVSPILKPILERRIADIGPNDHVFTYRPKAKNRWQTGETCDWRRKICFTRSTLTRKFGETCERAGILRGDHHVNDKGEKIGIVFHCFRHTRITRWIEEGYPEAIIRMASGHLSSSAFRVYTHLNDARTVMSLARGNDRDEMRKPREEKEAANAGINHQAGCGDAESTRVHSSVPNKDRADSIFKGRPEIHSLRQAKNH